jgi:hypothetical protein
MNALHFKRLRIFAGGKPETVHITGTPPWAGSMRRFKAGSACFGGSAE